MSQPSREKRISMPLIPWKLVYMSLPYIVLRHFPQFILTSLHQILSLKFMTMKSIVSVVIYSLDRWFPSSAPCSIFPPKILVKGHRENFLVIQSIIMREELVEYQFYLQHKLASEIWEFRTNFSDLGLWFFLAKQPKIWFFSTSPANKGSPPKPGRLAAWWCCARALRRPCARCARLRAVRAAVRSRVWWRASRAAAPWLRPGVQGREGEFEWERIRVQMDLEKIQRGRRRNLSLIPNVGVGYFE